MIKYFRKGGVVMKDAKTIIAKMAKRTAEKALKRDANSTTCGAVYQPKAPAQLKKFSKIDK